MQCTAPQQLHMFSFKLMIVCLLNTAGFQNSTGLEISVFGVKLPDYNSVR